MLHALKLDPDYDTIRRKVTLFVLEAMKADESGAFSSGVIMSLFASESRGRQSGVEKEENARTYDMDILLPEIARLPGRPLSDPAAVEGLQQLLAAYAEELKAIRANP